MHCFVEVLDFLSKAVQVEVISDVVFVDFNKELVALQVTEP